MSLTKEDTGNKTKTKQTTHRNQADQAHVRSSLEKQKVQIRRPNTEVKRGDEFFSKLLSVQDVQDETAFCLLAGRYHTGDALRISMHEQD